MTAKIRILLIGDLWYLHVRRWALGLARYGIDVSVLSETNRNLPGIRVISSTVPPWRPWRPRRWLGRWQSVFRRAINEVSFDLIHLHYPHPYSLFLGDIGNYPLIVSTWGSEIVPMVVESDRDRERKVSFLRRANRVVASSQFLADATAHYAGMDRNRIVMHYWGVDLDQFRPRAEPCNEPVIGFAKNLAQPYGAEYLIDALPQVLRVLPGTRVLMLGRGNLESSLRRRADRLAVGETIQWVGPIDHSLMPDYYSRMALSVMPSTHPSETLGLSALESQAMGVPVVASRIGGIPESVVDGETGILVPPRDSQALAAAILELLLNRDLRNRLGRQGRPHVERHFDWRRTMESMIELYRGVMTS
jgi:L-malate glycosyltransferase